MNTSVILPIELRSSRLLIKEATLNDRVGLQKLWESSRYMKIWDGQKKESEDYIKRCIIEGSLPPNGVKEKYQIKGIYESTTNEAIGLLEIYHGYPNENTLYIGFLYIQQKEQKLGYATEVVSKCCNEAKKSGYKRVRLAVALKNWGAIRFWYKMGFDKITKIVGDSVHSETTFANMELEKLL